MSKNQIKFVSLCFHAPALPLLPRSALNWASYCCCCCGMSLKRKLNLLKMRYATAVAAWQVNGACNGCCWPNTFSLKFASLLPSPLAVAHTTIESVAHRDCWTCQAGGRRKRGGSEKGRQLQSQCTLCCRIAVIGKVLSKVAPHAPLQLQLLWRAIEARHSGAKGGRTCK